MVLFIRRWDGQRLCLRPDPACVVGFRSHFETNHSTHRLQLDDSDTVAGR